MALTTCPECGREKVSDAALACPDCGFNLREYFSDSVPEKKVDSQMQIAPEDMEHATYSQSPANLNRKYAKYSPEEIKQMEKKADKAVLVMTAAGVGIGFAPVMIDIAALMASMGAGVVAVGKCFMQEITKDEAGDLIKQFFKAAGLTYSMIFVGQKLTASVLKSNPVTYIPMMISDAAMCGATAFAVGATTKSYFSRKAQGKKATEEDIRKWMKEGKKQGKSVARAMAKKKAEEESLESN